jgi:integrase
MGACVVTADVMQQKTQHPVQFEITEQTRTVLEAWMYQARLRSEDFLFPSRLYASDHFSTRQYARIVKAWVTAIGLDPTMYGTHTLRRTKASLIYRKTKNLRAVQLLLGHTKLESTGNRGRCCPGNGRTDGGLIIHSRSMLDRRYPTQS